MGSFAAQVDRELGSSADEVHNLEFVAAADCSCGPRRAGDDFAIVLNGDAVSFELERCNQLV